MKIQLLIEERGIGVVATGGRNGGRYIYVSAGRELREYRGIDRS